MYLNQEGLLFNNIYMIANLFEFDENGKVVKIKEPIIYSLNKAEIALKDFPIFEKIANRKNVILLGDGIDDNGMIEGFDFDEIIRIGFLNENVSENKQKYLENFDVVITGDGDMNYVNDLLKQILGS